MSMKSSLCAVASVSLFGMFVVVGCSASGADDPVESLSFEDGGAPAEGDGSSSQLPDSSAVQDSGTKKDAASPPKNDAGKDAGDPESDAGSDAESDAGTDAGTTTAYNPGDTCAAADQVASRSCGMCGKQQTICQGTGTNGSLVWSSYGPCANEVGTCLPGTSRGCGNCGTQTCLNSCVWSACTGEPVGSCPAGTVDRTTAGCPAPPGGFKTRACTSACQWKAYPLTCSTPTPAELWAGTGSNSMYMRASDGALYAWGRGWQGMLGDGDTSNTNRSKITGAMFDGVTSLQGGGALSFGYACATFTNGSAKCWGQSNTNVSLGDGTTQSSATGITPIGFEANVVSIVSGFQAVCGLFSDGTAKCWGANGSGQLGSGATTSFIKTPVPVSLTGISQLYAGYETYCARKGDAAYCWGANTTAQVGDGTLVSKFAPVPVIASGVASLAPGNFHNCAVMADGTVKCWGQNTLGQVGNGLGGTAAAANVTSPNDVKSAVAGIDGVGTLSGVADMCSGTTFSCARLTDGRVACWGSNSTGQLGVGTLAVSNSPVPKLVSGVTASKLACGTDFVCAADGANVKCWGSNSYSQSGASTGGNVLSPGLVSW